MLRPRRIPPSKRKKPPKRRRRLRKRRPGVWEIVTEYLYSKMPKPGEVPYTFVPTGRGPPAARRRYRGLRRARAPEYVY